MVGFAEATITLRNGINFYKFPVGFRNFIQLEKRAQILSDTVTGTRVDQIIRSKNFYTPPTSGRWAEVITASKGFRLYPAPVLAADEDWTLLFNRAPCMLHYAIASAVGNQSLTTGTPPTDGGEVICVPNYYNGIEINVFSEEGGSVQTNWVHNSTVSNGKVTFQLKYPWDPKPRGEVWYEIMPTLPYPYDALYALDAALPVLDQRERPGKALSLTRHRNALWSQAQKYFASNVSDRGPTRVTPASRESYQPLEVPLY